MFFIGGGLLAIPQGSHSVHAATACVLGWRLGLGVTVVEGVRGQPESWRRVGRQGGGRECISKGLIKERLLHSFCRHQEQCLGCPVVLLGYEKCKDFGALCNAEERCRHGRHSDWEKKCL
jgi:hypothetical protein